MRFVDEFRSGEVAKHLSEKIAALVEPGRRYKFMEVCGGHTHAIYKHGVEDVLPDEVELIHGPGCPVCVIPMGRQDDAIALARRPEVIFTTFGDMVRVPATRGSLLDAKAQGADVRMVYSPLDALRVARENPDREVVFFAIGFENVYARQLIALGGPGDVALAISTSGSSASVVAGLETARRRGMVTVALVGYDGGRAARLPGIDHPLVVPGDYVPRLQEAQATAYHLILDAVGRRP